MERFKHVSKDREIESAKSEITQAEAMKLLLSNNTLAAEVSIAGMRMGTCDNTWLIPVIDKQIGELNKFINGEPNLWE